MTVTVRRAEREPDQRVHLCRSADGEQRAAEQRANNGRDGGDDHGDELCRGSDGDVWRYSGDQRGGGEQHDDYGDDTGREAGAVTVTVTNVAGRAGA